MLEFLSQPLVQRELARATLITIAMCLVGVLLAHWHNNGSLKDNLLNILAATIIMATIFTAIGALMFLWSVAFIMPV